MTTQSIKDEYNLIFDFINSYYNFGKNQSPELTYNKIKELVSIKSQSHILEGYKKNLDFLKKENIQVEVVIKKILKENFPNTFTVHVHAKKISHNLKDYFLKIQLKTRFSLIDGGKLKISEVKESFLNSEDKSLKEKTVFTNKNIVTSIEFPCVPSSVSTKGLNSSKVEYKIIPENKMVSIFSKDQNIEKTTFKVVCQKRIFNFNITSNDKLTTLYRRLSREEGVIIKIALTEKQKFIKAIEKELGIKIIE